MESSDQPSKYALHEAARDGRLSTVETLLANNPKLSKLQDEDDRLALHWAAAYNHLEIVKVLSSTRSFDPDTTDSSGWTALMIASSLKDDAGLSVIQHLLSRDAEVKTPSTTGATALHFATSKGNLEVVRMLLSNGASVRLRDRRGQLPIHRAAAAGNLPIAEVLIGAKSPLDATDVDGMTPLHQAISEGNGDVALELIRAGAVLDKRDVDGRLAIDCVPDAKVRSYIVKAAEAEGIDL